MSAAHGNSTAEIVSTLRLFRNDIVKQLLQAFLDYDSEQQHRKLLEGTVMSIARIDASVATVVCCDLERVKQGGHCQK